MHLVQLLLPLYDNAGAQFPKALYQLVRTELVERFGGLTAYAQAPISGLWQDQEDSVVRDDLIIYEVMTDDLDAAWWSQYRATLEQRFRQDQLVIRAHPVRLL
jgi:hypothetical protein